MTEGSENVKEYSRNFFYKYGKNIYFLFYAHKQFLKGAKLAKLISKRFQFCSPNQYRDPKFALASKSTRLSLHLCWVGFKICCKSDKVL